MGDFQSFQLLFSQPLVGWIGLEEFPKLLKVQQIGWVGEHHSSD